MVASLMWLVAPPSNPSMAEIEQLARQMGMVYREEVLPWNPAQETTGDSETSKNTSQTEVEKRALEQEQGHMKLLEIRPGSSLEEVAALLTELELIPDRSEFIRKVQERGLSQRIRAGSYQVSPGTDESELLTIITSGSSGRIPPANNGAPTE